MIFVLAFIKYLISIFKINGIISFLYNQGFYYVKNVVMDPERFPIYLPEKKVYYRQTFYKKDKNGTLTKLFMHQVFAEVARSLSKKRQRVNNG